MYQALLTRKYLTSKIIPLFGVFAVMLCSGMVLVTWSIMGGFLTMLLAIGRDMEGDVTIAWPTVGFPYYEELIARLEADPMVSAACPMIETFGIVALPDGRKPGVQIKGVDQRYAKVTAYEQALWWKPIREPLPKDKDRRDPRLAPDLERVLNIAKTDGLRFKEFDLVKNVDRPAVVLGIEMSDYSIRKPEGYYVPAGAVGRRLPNGEFEWEDGAIIGKSVTITVLPLSENTRDLGLEQRTLPVANEFRTGLFEADKSTVLIDLNELQHMLKMDAWQRAAPSTGDPYEISPGGSSMRPTPTGKIEPARVTTVLVKGRPDPRTGQVDPNALRDRCIAIWNEFAAAHAGEVPTPKAMEESRTIATFEMQRATFIGSVKQETVVVLMLLMVISFVAACLILAIFWAMVAEKTKDIGTLRAVGAGRAGIAWLWLRYGLAIGFAGVVLGLIASWLLVTNVNEVHDWIQQTFHRTVWDPKVYYFSKIPNEVNPVRALIVAGGALGFSLLGALVPALRAAWMDPVKALRFE